MSRFVYLHGFASGPSSQKARFFRDRFAELGIGLEVPDLAEGKFEQLTISGQLAVMERVARDEPASFIGSSMGGYLAALYAARHAELAAGAGVPFARLRPPEGLDWNDVAQQGRGP